VPLIVALLPDGLNDKPAGSAPGLIDHEYGAVPPDAEHVAA
jgi:hypothetical protein